MPPGRLAGDRDPRPDLGALPGRASQVDRAAQRVDAVGEPAQARAAGQVRAADAVVAHLDHGELRRAPHAHGRELGGGVLGDVGERLGDEVVGGGLDWLWQADGGKGDDLDRYGRARGELVERAGEALMAEDRRVDAAGQLAQLTQGEPELLARVREKALRALGIAVDLRLQRPDLQRERDEALLRAVVEVALEPAALGVLDLDQAS